MKQQSFCIASNFSENKFCQENWREKSEKWREILTQKKKWRKKNGGHKNFSFDKTKPSIIKRLIITIITYFIF